MLGIEWRLQIPKTDEHFPPSGDGTTPDFNDIEIVDCGNTIRLGEYECRVWR